MRSWFAFILLMTASAGEPRAQIDGPGFCATLQRLVAAARERPAFVSLGGPGPTRAAYGLGFEDCRIERGLYGRRLVCECVAEVHYRRTGLTPEDSIARCLPEALRMSEPEGSRLTRFRLGLLAVHVERLPQAVRFSLFALPVER